MVPLSLASLSEKQKEKEKKLLPQGNLGQLVNLYVNVRITITALSFPQIHATWR